MNIPLVSIIVPVYKAERWLHHCVDSILVQTMGDFELLLIDDGSPDRSGEICDEYAAKDSRVRVFHKENGGVSSARNMGLENAYGEWISFVDADDFVEENYITELLDSVKNDESLVVSGLKKEKNGIVIDCVEFSNEVIDKSKIEVLFGERKIFEYGYPFSKLYRADILQDNNIRFNQDVHYAEDLLFLLEYLLHIDNIVFCDKCNYIYKVDNSVLSQRFNSFESEYCFFSEYSRLNKEIASKYGFIKTKESLRYGALALMRSLYSLYQNEQYDRDKRITILKQIKLEYKSFIKLYYLPNLSLFKLVKILFLKSVYLFDLFCVLKFKR